MQGLGVSSQRSALRKKVVPPTPTPLPNPTYSADLLATRATPLLLPRPIP